MSVSLQQKVAVVTGASTGLGKEVARQLCDEGVKVFALARSIEQTELPASATKIVLNIRDLESIDKAFAQIDEQTSRIDILVNCAGRGLIKELEKTSREEIMDILGVNLKGNIYIAQEVYTRMIKAKSGHIINVGSTTSIKARADEPIYAASKWGLRGFTESLRLAARAHKIRVTGVYPGGMQTPFWDNDNTKDTSQFMNPSDVASIIVDILKTPIATAPTEYVIERGIES